MKTILIVLALALGATFVVASVSPSVFAENVR